MPKSSAAPIASYSDLRVPDAENLQKIVDDLVAATRSLSAQHAAKSEVRIRNLRSERLDLTADLLVVIEERGDQYLATSFDTGQYGHGYSPDHAIENLCSLIEEYYDLLTEDEGRLSPRLAAHLRFLRSILRVRE